MKHYQVQWVQKDSQDATPKSNNAQKKAKNDSSSKRDDDQDNRKEKVCSIIENYVKVFNKYQQANFSEGDDELLSKYFDEGTQINKNCQGRRQNQYQLVPKHQSSENVKKQNNRQNWRNTKNNQEATQLNDREKRIYNSKTVVGLFKQKTLPFTQVAPTLFEDFPTIFLKTPITPLNHDSENEEPEWLQEDDSIFEFKDIEAQLEEKRIKYQIDHGTLERKQQERLEKEIERKKQEQQNKEIEEEKEKFRQKKKQQSQQSQIQKQSSESTSENNIENQLQQLFQIVGNQNQIQGVSLEEIERDLQKLSINQRSVSEIEEEILKNSPPKKASSQQAISHQETKTQQAKQQQSQDFDLYSFLNVSEVQQQQQQQQQIDIPPNQRIIPLEKINNEPFSTQAVLNSRKPTELTWFYIDRNQKIQGGFSSVNMDQWYKQGYLMPDLQISWEKPGVWISLNQFIDNLDLISRGELGINKAMQCSQVKPKPEVNPKEKEKKEKDKIQQAQQQQQSQQKLNYNNDPKMWNAVQQQMMQQMNPYQYVNQILLIILQGQNTINVLNNVIQINPQQTLQPQPLDYYQQYQYQQQQQQQLIQYYQRQLQALNASKQKLFASIQQQGTAQQKQQLINIQQQQQQIQLQIQYQLQMQQYMQQQQLIQQQYSAQGKRQNEILSDPIFQIGLKKENIQQNAQTEYVPNSNEFPSLSETDFVKK